MTTAVKPVKAPNTPPLTIPRPHNVLIVGVGGQGVIMISKVLATLCQEQGFEVKQSEVHGMAKRGGAVFSHVRFGEIVHSPTIPEGEADVLLALEWAEGMRWMPYLRQQSGTFIADTQRIVPPFACRNRTRGARTGYVGETIQTVMEQVENSFALDAMGIAKQLGVVKAANTVLLGALSTALDFPTEAWKSVISKFVPPQTTKVNLLAFDAGQEWALGFDRESELRNIKDTRSLHQESTVEAGADYSRVEITEEWCKGCDICVKFCPERCLIMNEKLIVEMAEPELCTGCRMCEWLCPDFAITVHTPNHVPL